MPSNTTPETATVVAALPFSVTQDVNGGADTAFTGACDPSAIYVPVWFAYTPPAGVTAVGIRFASSNGFSGSYAPVVTVWTGTPPALTLGGTAANFGKWCFSGGSDPTGQIAITVIPGTTYYFQVASDTTPADSELVFHLDDPPTAVAPIGSALITNDTFGYPAAITSPTDGSVLVITGLPSTEEGSQLDDGTLALLVENSSTLINAINLYDGHLQLIVSVATPILGASAISPLCRNAAGDGWFVCLGKSSANQAVVYQLSAAGVFSGNGGAGWNLYSATSARSGHQVSAIAVSADDTILYFMEPASASSGDNIPIHCWDLVHDVQLPDLVAEAAIGHLQTGGRDLLRIDTALIGQLTDNSLGKIARRWNVATGAVEMDYTLAGGSTPRLADVPRDTTAFGVMFWPDGTTSGVDSNQISLIHIADGTVLSSTRTLLKEPRDQSPPEWGPSQSCPLILLTQPLGPPPPPVGHGCTLGLFGVDPPGPPLPGGCPALPLSEES